MVWIYGFAAVLAATLTLNLFITRRIKARFNPADTGNPRGERMLVGMAPIPKVTLPHQSAGFAFSLGSIPVSWQQSEPRDTRRD